MDGPGGPAGLAPHFPETAIFDLDSVLLNADATSAWLRDRLSRSRLRSGLGVLIEPVAGLLMTIPPLRRFGVSLRFWIASVGLSQAELRGAFEEFALRFQAGESPLRWRIRALAALDEHLRSGDRLVVVTTLPTALAFALIAGLERDIDVLGSSLRPMAAGWVFRRYCNREETCAVLLDAGYGTVWRYAYSGRAEDLPLLARARSPRLLRGGGSDAARFGESLVGLERLDW